MRQSLLPVFCQLVVLCDGVHPRSPLWLLACLHVVHNYRWQKVYFGSGRTDCVLRSPFLNTYAWCINIVWGIYGTVSVILFNPCRETRAQNHFGNSRHTTGRRFEMSQCAKFSVRIRAKKKCSGMRCIVSRGVQITLELAFVCCTFHNDNCYSCSQWRSSGVHETSFEGTHAARLGFIWIRSSLRTWTTFATLTLFWWIIHHQCAWHKYFPINSGYTIGTLWTTSIVWVSVCCLKAQKVTNAFFFF